jgi:hypothetical protein
VRQWWVSPTSEEGITGWRVNGARDILMLELGSRNTQGHKIKATKGTSDATRIIPSLW